MDVSDILDEFTEHGFGDIGIAERVRIINDTIYDFCAREPWPFLERSIDLTYDGTSSVATNFPSDFRAMVSLTEKGTERDLYFSRLDEVEKAFGLWVDVVGQAVVYYFQAGQLKVVRIPTSDTVLRMKYLIHPTVVTSDSNEAAIIVPVQHHRAVVLGSLSKLYPLDDDLELGSYYDKKYEERIQTAHDSMWHQNYDSPEHIYVTPEW